MATHRTCDIIQSDLRHQISLYLIYECQAPEICDYQLYHIHFIIVPAKMWSLPLKLINQYIKVDIIILLYRLQFLWWYFKKINSHL